MPPDAPLHGKRITLCVAGSIAAYRAADVCSKLVQAGATVFPLMTESATGFLHPRTLSTLSGNPCHTSLADDDGAGGIAHIERAQATDLILVAPASANTIAHLAHGLCPDVVSATCLAATVPVVLSPAMNSAMWDHPATRANVALLAERGVEFVPTRHGRLACGTVGDGKIAETPDILSFVEDLLRRSDPARSMPLAGKRVLVSVGGSREAIDAVRFIGNASSGKMGAALAGAALDLGAEVDIVAGPGVVPLPPAARVVDFTSTRELQLHVERLAPSADLVLMAAAPADYRIAAPLSEKWKRGDGPPTIALVENPDILQGIAAMKQPGRLVVGFAAEAGDPAPEAIRKCRAKGCDFIVGNDIASPHGAFGSETTELVLCDGDGMLAHIPPMSKRDAALRLLEILADRLARPRID